MARHVYQLIAQGNLSLFDRQESGCSIRLGASDCGKPHNKSLN
jgi:hypothetical protein